MLRSARLTAIAAALRLVRKTLFGEKMLFSSRENELGAAVFTGEDFIFQHVTPRVVRAGLDATALREFLQQGRSGQRGAITLVAAIGSGSLPCLREILGREYAEADRRSGSELHVHDSARALSGDQVKVRGLAADNRSDRYEGVEATAVDKISARQRQLEASRNFEDADIIVGDIAVPQRALGAVDELLGEVGMEARGYDRKAPSRTIRCLARRRLVRLHEAATSSRM